MNEENYNSDKNNDQVTTNNELESMFSDNSSYDKGNSKNTSSEKTGNKVLMKTSGSQLTTSTNGEEGYSTVFGVVLLIISVGFILTALIMAIPI